MNGMRTRTALTVIVIVVAIALVAYYLNARSTPATASNSFNLAEFGIALDLPSSLKGLTYSARVGESSSSTILYMQLPEGCDLGAFYTIRKDAVAKSGTSWTEATLKQFEAPQGTSPAQVKEFTDFYLVFEPSQAACASGKSDVAKETQRRLDLWNALTSAHYMQ